MTKRPSRLGTRSTAALAALTAGGMLVTSAPATASPTPPPNPSAGQISAAQAAKNALGAEVGQLSGQVAAAQSELSTLQGQAEMAEQRVAYALSQQQSAQAAETVAKAAVERAAATVNTAHTRFVRYLQASYMTGTSDTSTGALLTAPDPTSLLQRTTLERYEAENKVDAIGNLQTATVAKSNADGAARRATVRAQQAAANARRQKAAADSAVSAQQTQEATLEQTLSTNQAELTSAQSQLSILNHEHAQFLAYQAEQRRLAAARAARLRAERLAAEKAAAALRARQAREAQLAREQAAERRAAAQRHRASGGSAGSGGGSSSGSGSGSSSGSGGSGGGSYSPPPSSSGGWTAAKGRYAVRRAKAWLGEPYAWAGGGASGPSYGVCDPSNGAPNDCHVVGFDCSGLAMYAWGPYLSMDHYALRQYSEAGSYHPSIGNLRPGDLLFYSFNGAVSGIHHVAIYIGGGQIIQAPYSGAYVEISSMYDPGSIFGATRPLT